MPPRLRETEAVPEDLKMIVFERCCNTTPNCQKDGDSIYFQCPVCGRESGRIPVRREGKDYLAFDQKITADICKRWNAEVVHYAAL